MLGLAWARTLMEMRRALTRLVPCAVVQLTGALSRPDVDESSIELVRDVARISGGPAYFFYAPMIVPDAATARALRTQPEIARATSRYPEVTKAVVGLGAWEAGQSTVADAVSERERREQFDLGVRAETCGIQLDAEGDTVTTPLTERIIGIDAEQLRARARGHRVRLRDRKAGAVEAAVRGGHRHQPRHAHRPGDRAPGAGVTRMPDAEERLPGGTTNAGRVTRVGDTVRRPSKAARAPPRTRCSSTSSRWASTARPASSAPTSRGARCSPTSRARRRSSPTPTGR